MYANSIVVNNELSGDINSLSKPAVQMFSQNDGVIDTQLNID